jgi:uncharacterized caspase-like protein
MRKILNIRYAIALAFCGVSIAAAQSGGAAREGKRIALIVGNNAYSMSPLQNAVNDARLIDKALQGAGFTTTLKVDATKVVLEQAALEFLNSIGPDDTVLFFYAGHGIQMQNENFLVPVDFEVANTFVEAKFKMFPLAYLFDALKEKRPKRTIILLDACRTNAGAESHETGLAQPQNAGSESYIAYSTSPGQVAADNPSGRDSWFTEALADLIDQDALTIDDVFTRVRSRVSSETSGRQTPWVTSSLTSKFYFHPPSNLKADSDPTVAEKWLVDAQVREDRGDWEGAIGLLRQIQKLKPGGLVESTANARLPYLEARKEALDKYSASDFGAAAAQYEKALSLDPFSMDTAFEAAYSFLLIDRPDDAARLLSIIRLRGTTASAARAEPMLKELAAISPEAAKALTAGRPEAPPIQQMFTAVRFGDPDWSAGRRYVEANPMQLSGWLRKVDDIYAVPPAAAPVISAAPSPAGSQPAQSAPDLSSGATNIAMSVFHVEIVPVGGGGRDIGIRRIGPSAGGSVGFLKLEGPDGVPVLIDGSPHGQIPSKLAVPPGKYVLRTVENGNVLREVPLDVTDGGIQEIRVAK